MKKEGRSPGYYLPVFLALCFEKPAPTFFLPRLLPYYPNSERTSEFFWDRHRYLQKTNIEKEMTWRP